MSRLPRYAALVIAIAAMSACSSSVTEPSAPKCAATPDASSQSCANLDLINPKI
jgi:hypothetical protein